MKKILLSLIYCLSFQFILNRKRIIKKIEIFLLLNSCLIATGYSQALDLGYGSEGKVLISSPNDFYFNGNPDRGNESGAMALQKDGKLLVAYNALRFSENHGFGIVRLNPDGSLDDTFSDDGKAYIVISDWNSPTHTSDISVAPGGKIVITGSGSVTRAGINYYAFIASRFNTDGTPDNSFDGDGTLILNESVIAKGSASVAIQPDGKILLAGAESDPLGELHYKIVRLNTNGTLDNSFGIGGILIGPEALSGAGKIRLQPDGKIVVAGYIQNRFDRNIYHPLIVRLNANGSIDSGFGINGKTIVEFGYPSSIKSIAFQSDGRILVAGASNKPDDNPDGDDSDYIIARLNQDGTLDNSFDEDGKKVIDFDKSNDRYSFVSVRSDGLIFLNGDAAGQFGIVCLNEDGSFNERFDRDGKLLLSFDLAEGGKGYDILIQGDGKILVSGISDLPAIARFVFDNNINSFPPLLDSIGSKSVNELEELHFTAKATDKDTPANLLKYSLAKPIAGDFPRGARIDASTGIFSWTPTEETAGRTYFLKIVVSDGSNIDDEIIRIDVQEVIEPSFPPSLDSIGFQSVNELDKLSFIAKATDKDTPFNLLKYSLTEASSGAFPTGAKIDAFTGEFSWTPTEAQGPGTYYLTILVSDGSNIDEEEIRIDVREVNLHPILYSTTSSGGKGNGGTIIKFLPSSNSLTVVKSFEFNSKEGYSVTGSLIQGNDKKLYGMTTSGGKMGFGVIFSLDPATSTYTKLKDFDNVNGANPRGGLMLANNNKLYGMTEKGGTNNKGVIFSFDPSTSTYTKLKDFNGDDGANPWGSLIQAADGKLYGMTRAEGDGQGGFYIKFSYGVIFSYDITTATYIKLKDFITPFFDDNIGKSPYGNLVQANNGILYGMTHDGGFENYGTVFSFDPITLQHNNFINFNDFENPFGSLIQANDGKLYGMDYGGGGNGDGEILSIDLPGLDQASFSFDPTTGIRPLGTLLQAKDGYLYGTTSEGGTHQKGIIFSFDISTGIITKRKDFDGENGAFPGINSSFIEVSIDEINTAPVLTAIGNKSINELEDFRFTAKATDKDSPANTLKFSLANAATGKFPEGATIDKSSGLFCWTPTEAQGPGTYRVKIVVSDGECTDEEEIEIKVCEINSKPVLATIGDQTVDENKVLTFTAKAADKDIPENTLKFSLADPSSGDFPTGASINASTGAFNWLPAKTQVPGTFRVKVIVSDGTSTDEEEFAIHVRKTSPASLTAYPNPSAQRATVRFAVPTDEAMVTLVVYDFKGQQINRLYEGRAEANKPYSFDLDGSTLSPGVYLIRLSMSQKAETFKIIITE